MGLNTAREMLFLGHRYTAADLHRMGVAWRVVPDDQLQAEAAAVAAQLAGLPTLSVQAMKRTLNSTATTDLRAALAAETAATVAGFLDPLTTQLLQDFG